MTPPYTISMTAEPAFDAWAGVIEYYFECVTCDDDSNSGWSPDATYVITGILNSSATYGYRVKARDERGYETQWSAIGYATTGQPQVDVTPPDPYDMTWASPPAAIPGSSTSITMTATTATDSSQPVRYYFECTSNGAFTSTWQTNTTYVAAGLTPNTLYTFTVKARDNASPPNETGVSVPASATTNAEGQVQDTAAPVLSVQQWAIEPYETGTGQNARVFMTAGEATDAGGNGVWYQFECSDNSATKTLYSGDCADVTDGYSSDWIPGREWNNICVHLAGQGHLFHYRVRDNLWNISVWSSTLPAL
jgi:hypothetical protein